ncbi:MAG: membrane protein insertion efficiency factor YidD [Clostridia bacterium]|nr:membrane protein insertion efficiency factor YidD [Clostridia bacterium]
MIVFKIIFYPVKLLCYGLIYFYKFVISPLLPSTCIYYPTCSSYMLLAIKEHGVFKGIWLGTKRIFRCTPKHTGGLDLVPLNIKGDKKWIF